jgi:hypothetical protein
MYLVAVYQPTTLFSLRDSQATSGAAKTLLIPSPYSVKMALLDVAIHWQGLKVTQEVFIWLKALTIRAAPPEIVVVNNTFIKIQRSPKSDRLKKKPEEPFIPTIAFREYAQFLGKLHLAFDLTPLDQTQCETLKQLLLRVNYFGKRGCFFQLLEFQEQGSLDSTYSYVQGDLHAPSIGIMHYLDDFGSKMTWEMANTFDKKSPDRVTNPTLIPYRMTRSTKRSTLYTRTDKN